MVAVTIALCQAYGSRKSRWHAAARYRVPAEKLPQNRGSPTAGFSAKLAARSNNRAKHGPSRPGGIVLPRIVCRGAVMWRGHRELAVGEPQKRGSISRYRNAGRQKGREGRTPLPAFSPSASLGCRRSSPCPTPAWPPRCTRPTRCRRWRCRRWAGRCSGRCPRQGRPPHRTCRS